jgi:Icc-related predicted phosphoesterase
MIILFVTDLHGCLWKYDQLYHVAKAHKADIVINGGDMLPKNSILFQQDIFITQKLEKHFNLFNKAKIHYLCCLGNDDLMVFDPVFDKTCRQYEYIYNIAQHKINIEGIDFIGMNWVVDYPFRLKDRCRMDTRDYIFQRQFGTGLLSTSSGWKEVKNWYSYANTLPTIKDELNELPLPQDSQNSVYIIHMPPAHLGLDTCGNGENVGSQALYDFLKIQQPKLSLHGHIHESPEMTGMWKSKLGKTICIQPGQTNAFIYVTINTNTMEIERYT